MRNKQLLCTWTLSSSAHHFGFLGQISQWMQVSPGEIEGDISSLLYHKLILQSSGTLSNPKDIPFPVDCKDALEPSVAATAAVHPAKGKFHSEFTRFAV